MSAIRQFLSYIRANAVRAERLVETVAMGKARTFERFDLGDDTFIFERGILRHFNELPSVLVLEKSCLRRRVKGHVLTVSTGNHSVAAFPLLDGRFWDLSKLQSSNRSETLIHSILCSNIVNGKLEISQREVPLETLIRLDDWLLSLHGLGLGDVVMADRIMSTLEHYRRLGEEWRVKPLEWTANGMRVALAAARRGIASSLRYYHSARGVHLLSFPEFSQFAAKAKTDPEEFVKGLKELVSVYEGNSVSFVRMPKYRGHHEIEFFGMRRGMALERLVPELEQLMEAITLGRIGHLGIIQRSQEIVKLYRSLLASPELADEFSHVFIDTLYMYVTGEIYSVQGEGSTPAFDDRRTALPGATFRAGRPEMHPGADERTEILLSNLRGVMSKDEIIEYANVYELRESEDETTPVGRGSTREVVYKTNRRPLENSLVQKQLSRSSRGYSAYMLARIGSLRALGFALSERYLILKRRSRKGGAVDYYIRNRCEGEPMNAIPATYFRSAGDASAEAPETILAVASSMGDAAAQNMAMKKFDPKTETPLFGIGKEILEFEYDFGFRRMMPKRVSTCSIRGSFGWPCLDYTEENLEKLFAYYFGHYAHALRVFWRAHPSVPMAKLAERFMSGFAFRTQTMAWTLSVMHDRFEAFDPDIPSRYRFGQRWKFLMWSLERQERRLTALRRLFFKKVKVEENEDLRNYPEPVRFEPLSR